MAKEEKSRREPINWGRAIRIFGNPKPPNSIWERQFDYMDDELQRVARTPYKDFDFSDLWYYFHDLAYSELQPDLFAYLFPVCLMDWHQSLMRNQSCSHGDAEFHYGIRHGQVFERMLNSEQRNDVFAFFCDSFTERVDAQRGLKPSRNKPTVTWWMHRLNSLGLIMPQIDRLWNQWWNASTLGRAICILQYCSGLIYFEGENVLFDRWTPEQGGGGPYIWEHDSSIYDTGWLKPNVQFLRQTLKVDYVLKMTKQAATRLAGEPESELAQSLVADAYRNREVIEHRVQELPILLSGERPGGVGGWTV